MRFHDAEVYVRADGPARVQRLDRYHTATIVYHPTRYMVLYHAVVKLGSTWLCEKHGIDSIKLVWLE